MDRVTCEGCNRPDQECIDLDNRLLCRTCAKRMTTKHICCMCNNIIGYQAMVKSTYDLPTICTKCHTSFPDEYDSAPIFKKIRQKQCRKSNDKDKSE